MNNNKTKRWNWRVWLCALLIAALTMLGVTAEEMPEVEVYYDEAVTGAIDGESIEVISRDDETEVSIEMDDEAIAEEAPVDIDLELDGLDVPELLVDGPESVDGVTEEADFAAETNSSRPEDFVIEDGVLVKYVGPGGDVVIPDGVTCIGDYAFSVSSIENVTIPDGVVKISDHAFYNCSALKSVIIR